MIHRFDRLHRVTALSKAAQINKAYDTMALANSVGAGAVHAIESGFGGGKQPRVLRSFIDSLQRQVKKIQAQDQGQQEDANALFGAFSGVTEKRNVGRKDQPRGST